MKVESKIFKGIEYVQLKELPQSQQDRIIHTINHNLFIKIMIDGKILSQCLQYKDYDIWYENEFGPMVVTAREDVVVREAVPVSQDLALR